MAGIWQQCFQAPLKECVWWQMLPKHSDVPRLEEACSQGQEKGEDFPWFGLKLCLLDLKLFCSLGFRVRLHLPVLTGRNRSTQQITPDPQRTFFGSCGVGGGGCEIAPLFPVG